MPALTLLCMLGAAGWPALAYILPPEHLMQRLAEKRADLGFSNLKVTLECGEEGKTGQEVLYLKLPGMVRWEKAGGVVEVCRGANCTRQAGAKREALPSWYHLAFWFFVTRSDGEGYLQMLRSWKIDTKTDTMARFGGRVAIVLGAKSWEGQKAQLWLDKNLYLPLRLIVPDGEEMVEIAWRGWGSRTGGDWFPERFEIRRGSKLLNACTTLEAKSGLEMSDALFR